MTKYQRELPPGVSHCLCSGMGPGLSAADMYSGIVPTFFTPALRGLAVTSLFSVLMWMFIPGATLPAVFRMWGTCSFLIVSFTFFFILSSGGVE